MKKSLITALLIIIVLFIGAYTFIYYVPFSKGVRSGELIKISNRGVMMKTWEGEISQGVSGAQIFAFSVEDHEKKVIESLKEFQGNYVKLHYRERYATFPWLGDTKYFIFKVEEDESPHSKR